MKDNLLVIDTDPGTDDALAIALAIELDRFHHKAFVSSYGNKSLTLTHNNLRRILSLLRFQGPIFRGASKPLSGEEFAYSDYHGIDGLGGLSKLFPDAYEGSEGNIDDLASLISSSNSCTYVAIGPLTNLAILLQHHPDLTGKLTSILIMGGGIFIWNSPHESEHNFTADPLAVKNVFERELPITLFTLDITHQHALSKEQVGEMPFERYPQLKQVLWANYDAGMRHDGIGAIVHDAMPMIYLERPETITVEPRRISIDNFGKTSIDESGNLIQLATSARSYSVFNALHVL